MTLEELTQGVMKRLGRTDIVDEVPRWINLGLKRICDDFVFEVWKEFYQIPQQYLGQVLIPLPQNTREVYDVFWSKGGVSEYEPLTSCKISDFMRQYPRAFVSPEVSDPVAYVVRGFTLLVYPVSNLGYMFVSRARYPLLLSNPGDIPEIPYDELIMAAGAVVGAIELNFQPSAKQVLFYEYESLLGRAKKRENEEPYRLGKLGQYRAVRESGLYTDPQIHVAEVTYHGLR